MFANPVTPSTSVDEGTVMQVDPVREVCRVVTRRGQKLDSVFWLRPYGGNERHGDFFTPRIGDRVVLDYGLGYPIIRGCLPRPQTGVQSFPVSIGSGDRLIDTGSYASALGALTSNASKPQDALLGDRIISSQGGGLLGMLRAGSVVLRSSKATEILLSRLRDVVRIVSRNYEHFTDLGTNVLKNIQGRVYRYYALSQTYSDSQQEAYKYKQYHGDVALAEVVKDQYQGTLPALPEASTTIFKEHVLAAGDLDRFTRTLDLVGSEDVKVTDGSSFTHKTMTNAEINLSFKDENLARLNDTGIDVIHREGHKIEVHAVGVKVTHSSGHVIDVNDGSITLTHSGGAQTVLDGSGVKTTFSGHFCNVTSSGVQLG